MTTTTSDALIWTRVCAVDALVPDRGAAALVDGHQVAIFRLSDSGAIHAVDHHDPFSRANVMARGLVGSRHGASTVASPMHKQSFDLATGRCLDDPDVSLRVWPTRVVGGWVEIGSGGDVTTLGPVLAGTQILVTAQRRAHDLSSALQRRGADVTTAASLGVESHIDEDTLLAQTRQIIATGADVVVVTTGIGFRGWLDTAESAGLAGTTSSRSLRSMRLVARGPKARGALRAAGLVPDWVAESETSAEIADFLVAEGVRGLSIAVQHHGAGDDGLEQRLAAAGGRPFGLVVYRWGPPPDPEAVERSVRLAAAGAYDSVVFTSAPGASAWLGVVRAQDADDELRRLEKDKRVVLAAVGHVTADPLRNAGFDPMLPDRARLGALVRSLVMYLGDASVSVPTTAGDLRVRAAAATLDHTVLPVSPSGLAILRLLAREPGSVRTREELLAVLPGDSDDPHSAEVAVARLREAVGKQVVQTVVKRGYRLEMREQA